MVLRLKAWESRSPPGLQSGRRPWDKPDAEAQKPVHTARCHRAGPTIWGAGWSSPVARQAHNLKVAGSNPAPATIRNRGPERPLFLMAGGGWCARSGRNANGPRFTTRHAEGAAQAQGGALRAPGKILPPQPKFRQTYQIPRPPPGGLLLLKRLATRRNTLPKYSNGLRKLPAVPCNTDTTRDMACVPGVFMAVRSMAPINAFCYH